MYLSSFLFFKLFLCLLIFLLNVQGLLNDKVSTIIQLADDKLFSLIGHNAKN